MAALAASGLRIGVDPMGGASVAYWGAIAERYAIGLTVVNEQVDPTFGFMTYDWDGKIRMDPSSPSAMAGLVALRDQFDLEAGVEVVARSVDRVRARRTGRAGRTGWTFCARRTCRSTPHLFRSLWSCNASESQRGAP